MQPDCKHLPQAWIQQQVFNYVRQKVQTFQGFLILYCSSSTCLWGGGGGGGFPLKLWGCQSGRSKTSRFNLDPVCVPEPVFRQWTLENVPRLGPDLLQSLLFTHEQRSRRFSTKTRVQRGQVRGGASRRDTTKMSYLPAEILHFCLQHINISIKSPNTCIAVIYSFWESCILFVYFYFCVCCVLETSSTRPLACSESCRGSLAVFSTGLFQALSGVFPLGLAGETTEVRRFSFGHLRSDIQPLKRMSGDYPEISARLSAQAQLCYLYWMKSVFFLLLPPFSLGLSL